MIKKALLVLLVTNIWATSYAANKPEDHINDKRIKIVSYKENDVIPIYGSMKHITHIDLGAGKVIRDIFAGDTVSWQVVETAAKDGVFIKPMHEDAKTNLTIITDTRKYYFEIKNSEWSAIYRVNFRYPEEEFAKMQKRLDVDKNKTVQSSLDVKTVSPENWNFSYQLEGDKTTSPLNMFDDGKFTYIEFGKKEIPAVFSVDSKKNESVVNFHRAGRYVVLEGIFEQLTMRNGVSSTCALNKEYQSQIDEISSLEANENLTIEEIYGER